MLLLHCVLTELRPAHVRHPYVDVSIKLLRLDKALGEDLLLLLALSDTILHLGFECKSGRVKCLSLSIDISGEIALMSENTLVVDILVFHNRRLLVLNRVVYL